MWYLLPCPPGSEERILQKYRKSVDGKILSDVFLFTCDRMRKYLGAWHHEQNNLFPGYIFLESDEARSVRQVRESHLRMMKEEEKMDSGGSVGTEWDITPLRTLLPEEQEVLGALGNERHHVAMSKGVIRGGVTFVTEGPLMGRENLIARIDRHKRTAFLKIPMPAGKCGVQVGLEITEKT